LYEVEEDAVILQNIKETMPKIYPDMLLLIETLNSTQSKLAKKTPTSDKLVITNSGKLVGKLKLYKNKIVVDLPQKFINIEVNHTSIKFLETLLQQ